MPLTSAISFDAIRVRLRSDYSLSCFLDLTAAPGFLTGRRMRRRPWCAGIWKRKTASRWFAWRTRDSRIKVPEPPIEAGLKPGRAASLRRTAGLSKVGFDPFLRPCYGYPEELRYFSDRLCTFHPQGALRRSPSGMGGRAQCTTGNPSSFCSGPRRHPVWTGHLDFHLAP